METIGWDTLDGIVSKTDDSNNKENESNSMHNKKKDMMDIRAEPNTIIPLLIEKGKGSSLIPFYPNTIFYPSN